MKVKDEKEIITDKNLSSQQQLVKNVRLISQHKLKTLEEGEYDVS